MNTPCYLSAFLVNQTSMQSSKGPYQLEDDVELEYYRIQKIGEGQIDLKRSAAYMLKGSSNVGTGRGGDEEILLSELIDILNERFGTDFTLADQLFFDQIQEEAISNDDLRQAVSANSVDDFKYVFDKAFESLVIDHMEDNKELFNKLMSDA